MRLDEVVLRALEKNPELRYQQVSEVKTRVETIVATPGGTGVPPTGPGVAPDSKLGNFVTVLRWRDRWIWDTGNVTLMAFVPCMVSLLLTGILFPFLGAKSLLTLLPGGLGLALAAIYAVVGSRVRKLKANLPKLDADVAEALFFSRPRQTPGLAVLHADRLELLGIALIDRLVIPLADIAAISEVRWFNGKRLWWKCGFVLDLKNGQRVGVAVAEPIARRWRARLSGGTLPEHSEAKSENLETVRRFSPLAILGAMLIPVFFASTVFWSFGHWGGLQALVGTVMTTLGFVSILVATVLGWISVVQIRRSGGRLYGMWLALVDGLVLPGLVLNAVLLFGLLLVNKLVNVWLLVWWYPVLEEHVFLNNPHFLIWLSFATTIVVGSNYVVIRGIWRALNRPANGPVKVAGSSWKTPLSVVAAVVGMFVVAVLVVSQIHPDRPFYIGQKNFSQGDYIEITSVERSANQMTVKGYYNLVSHDQALLALYITTTNYISVPTDSSQQMQITKGCGDFQLIHSHLVPGMPHVSMYTDGKPFAALYFGTKAEAAEEGKLNMGSAANAYPHFVERLQATINRADTSGEVSSLTQAGWQLWQARKLDEAAAKFQQAVQLAPDNADAWNGLGWAQFNAGQQRSGRSLVSPAVTIATNQPGALNGH